MQIYSQFPTRNLLYNVSSIAPTRCSSEVCPELYSTYMLRIIIWTSQWVRENGFLGKVLYISSPEYKNLRPNFVTYNIRCYRGRKKNRCWCIITSVTFVELCSCLNRYTLENLLCKDTCGVHFYTHKGAVSPYKHRNLIMNRSHKRWQ